MKFLKYFFVALLSIVVTLIAVNQYVPVLIDVPKKDRLLVDFNFGKEITNKELIPVERKAKNIILLIGDGMGSNQIVDGGRRRRRYGRRVRQLLERGEPDPV